MYSVPQVIDADQICKSWVLQWLIGVLLDLSG